jgi:hypothetical protein
MAVLPADLLHPAGFVAAAWFPGEDIAAYLALWIAEGESAAPDGATTAQVDGIARPWAYYRAHRAKANMIAASSSSVQISGAVAVSKAKDRHEYFSARAAAFLAEYEAALAIAEAPAAVAESTFVPTRTLVRSVAW